MARHIDLTDKLSTEKPTIKIGDLTLKVNDEKSNILKMNSSLNDYDGLNEVEMMDKSLEILIGKKSMKALDDLHLSIGDYKTVYFALMAVVNDQSLEEVEETFRKSNG